MIVGTDAVDGGVVDEFELADVCHGCTLRVTLERVHRLVVGDVVAQSLVAARTVSPRGEIQRAALPAAKLQLEWTRGA